ncbi:MAG: hypothetical protein ACTSPD_05390 [Promethearchaeota archaeon]
MSFVIKEVWIFTRGGIPLVDYCKDSGVNKTLLGSFFSALSCFSKELTGNELKSFLIKDYKFTATTCLEGEVVILCRSPAKAKEKTIKQVCKMIVKLFTDLYTLKDIKEWDGDLSKFDKFKEKLDLYIKMSNI